jgi:hypothetical protein
MPRILADVPTLVQWERVPSVAADQPQVPGKRRPYENPSRTLWRLIESNARRMTRVRDGNRDASGLYDRALF